MRNSLLLLAALTVLTVPALAQETAEAQAPAAEEKAMEGSSGPQVQIETSLGNFVIELDQAKAPKTVENFLTYVDSGFFDGTVFHRVIPDFMIQGGGFSPELGKKDTREPIQNEADNGLKNVRGTVAMARTNAPHSATAQFFVNTVDNQFLDHPGQTGWGYAVFGKVVAGMDVVDAISQVKTANRGRMANVPIEPVLIVKASRFTAP